MSKPHFEMFSDRRGEPILSNHTNLGMNLSLTCALGGRTAWSSKVTIDGHCMEARYWYDGNYLNNAKEDVAEVAYNWLMKN